MCANRRKPKLGSSQWFSGKMLVPTWFVGLHGSTSAQRLLQKPGSWCEVPFNFKSNVLLEHFTQGWCILSSACTVLRSLLRCILTALLRIEDKDADLPPVALNASITVGIITSVEWLLHSKGLGQEHMTALESLKNGLDDACFEERHAQCTF